MKRNPSEAVNGSIIVGYHEGLVWVGIARDVTDKGLVFETYTNEGKAARYPMKFDDLETSIHFQGYVLPQREPGASTTSPMLDYKGVRGFTGSAWAVKQFDLVAPKPGFNWQGAEKDWADAAQRKGWQVEKTPVNIKPGSLLIFQQADSKQIKVASALETIGNVLVFEYVDSPFSRVITARLTIEQLSDKTAFGGYVFQALIVPEKKTR